jgi:hypothetical protein
MKKISTIQKEEYVIGYYKRKTIETASSRPTI